MMMIPKFRVWHKTLKEMGEVTNINFKGESVRFKLTEPDGSTLTYPELFKNVFIEQSTGLKDKNGKEIFTGDIVKFQTTSIIDGSKLEFLAYVYFNEQYLAFLIKNINPICAFASSRLQEYLKQNREIIGNIHENPELMAEVKNEAKT